MTDAVNKARTNSRPTFIGIVFRGIGTRLCNFKTSSVDRKRRIVHLLEGPA
jgi:hypothetical protein